VVLKMCFWGGELTVQILLLLIEMEFRRFVYALLAAKGMYLIDSESDISKKGVASSCSRLSIAHPIPSYLTVLQY